MIYSSLQMQQARKLLWGGLLIFAIGSFSYKWYQNTQIISEFSVEGVVIKLQPTTIDSLAFIEVVTQQGELKRLSHKDLIIPRGVNPGDAIYKQAGSVSARINDQFFTLK